MIRKIMFAAGATFLFASPSFAATACHDAHGKFKKCPPAAAKPAPAPAAAKAAPCRDAHGKFIPCAKAAPAKPVPAAKCRLNGKFAKCGTPGAKPV